MRYILLFLFASYGLLIGSFLNVCIYRLPLRKKVTAGRSHCPACGHVLAATDLIPVLSYCLLGRRCRYCASPISARYASVELTTALIFVAAVWLTNPAGLDLALLRAVMLAAFFSALTVWSLIRFDQHVPPRGIYGWLFGPAMILTLIEQRPLLALLGLLTVLAVNFLLSALRLWQPLVSKAGHEVLALCALGLVLSWPGVMVFVLLEALALSIALIWHNFNRDSRLRPGRWLAPGLSLAGFLFTALRLLSIAWFV